MGTVVPLPGGRLQGIITVHGKRKRLPPFPKGTPCAMVEERTAAKAEQAAAMPAPNVDTTVIADADTPGGKWVTVWLADPRATRR